MKSPGNLCASPSLWPQHGSGPAPSLGRTVKPPRAADIVTRGHGEQPVGPLLGRGPVLSLAPTQFVLVISHAGAAESEATSGWFVARLEQ